jgi:hypothetical protein
MHNVWPCVDGSTSTEGCTDAKTPIESFELGDGDLLVMRGKTQQYWQHRVPKEKGRGPRLNINFRYILPGLDSKRGQTTYYKYMVYGDCPMERQPTSWTFDEIMKNRGGIMKFVQRGIKRKVNAKCNAGETGEESTEKIEQERTLKELACETPNKSAVIPRGIHSFKPDCGTNNSDRETQQYLTTEQGIDAQVFMALPIEIRNELVSQWKLQQLDASIINAPQQPLPKNNIHIKRKQSCKLNSTLGSKANSSRRGKIDSFFAKK